MDNDTPLLTMFMALPVLALVLFLFNNSEWVFENPDVTLFLAVGAGGVVLWKIFPELASQVKAFIPVLVIVGAILGGVMMMIFGGGADAVAGFGAKAREEHIDSLR